VLWLLECSHLHNILVLCTVFYDPWRNSPDKEYGLGGVSSQPGGHGHSYCITYMIGVKEVLAWVPWGWCLRPWLGWDIVIIFKYPYGGN